MSRDRSLLGLTRKEMDTVPGWTAAPMFASVDTSALRFRARENKRS